MVVGNNDVHKSQDIKPSAFNIIIEYNGDTH